MTKSDLIERLCEEQKLPRARAEILVNTIFDCLEGALRTGERVEVRGFGSFEIREYKAYPGRNPKTGSPVEVRPKRLPFFKVGKELKERVNAAVPSPGNGNGNGRGHARNGSGNSAASGNSSGPGASSTGAATGHDDDRHAPASAASQADSVRAGG